MTDADRPPLPKLPRRRRDPAPQTATFLALVGVMLVIGGLIALMMLVLPAELKVVVLLVGFVAGFFGGHYLIWGRWLDRRLRRQTGVEPEQFWRRPESPPAVRIRLRRVSAQSVCWGSGFSLDWAG